MFFKRIRFLRCRLRFIGFKDWQDFLRAQQSYESFNPTNPNRFLRCTDKRRLFSFNITNPKQIDLALIVVSLFKKDYPDFRALRVCKCCYPSKKHYGSEIKSHYDPEDSICKKTDVATPPFEIELYSSSLAKVTAGYYDFDYEKRLHPVISSGGDIGYRGHINKEKISTQAQKLSFLTGFFMRYGCNKTGNNTEYYDISVYNSLSAATACTTILKETGCGHVDYIDKTPDGHKIIFIPSPEITKLIRLIKKVNEEITRKQLAF